MTFTQAVVLAVLQGLTEFLPISSSAHLVLVPVIANWPDQGLAFDVAVHVGTLAAVLVYFHRDVLGMSRDWVVSLLQGRAVGQSRLAWWVIVATIPTGLAGLAVNALAGDALRSPIVIAFANLIFAAALWLADVKGARRRNIDSLGFMDALLIGCAQSLSLVPGASRAGVTMTAAMALGLGRRAAARFSFLIAIPVIALAGLLKTYEGITDQVPVQWDVVAVGVVFSAVCALGCIHGFMVLVERVGMLPFVLYRLALGGVLLLLFL
jgi:undecaprenyl-diphosphatase